jgi:hypothetical protein
VAQADRLMAVVAPSDPQLMELAARSIAHEIDSRPVVFGPMNFSDEWIGQIRRFSAEDHFWIYQELRTLGRTNGTVERIAGCYLRGRQIGLTFADLDEIMGWWIGHQPPQSVKRLLIELWNYGDLDDAEKFRRRVAAGEYGDRQVAENWNTYTRRRHVFAEWLAGESKPPRRVAADSGSAGRFEVVTKKLAGTFRPSTRNSGDEHPAPDHG